MNQKYGTNHSFNYLKNFFSPKNFLKEIITIVTVSILHMDEEREGGREGVREREREGEGEGGNKFSNLFKVFQQVSSRSGATSPDHPLIFRFFKKGWPGLPWWRSG